MYVYMQIYLEMHVQLCSCVHDTRMFNTCDGLQDGIHAHTRLPFFLLWSSFDSSCYIFVYYCAVSTRKWRNTLKLICMIAACGSFSSLWMLARSPISSRWDCECVCIYIHLYIYMYTYLYIIYIYMYIYVDIHICVYIYKNVHLDIYKDMCIHTRIQLCTYKYIYVYVYTFCYIYIYICINIYIYTYVYTCTYMYICVYICVY